MTWTREFLINLLIFVVLLQNNIGVEGLQCRICNSAVDDYCKKTPTTYCPGLGNEKVMNMSDTCSSDKNQVFYDCDQQADILQDWHELFGFLPEVHHMSNDTGDDGLDCPSSGDDKADQPCFVQSNRIVNAKTKDETFDVCVLMKITIPKIEGVPDADIINSPRYTRYCGYKKAKYINVNGRESQNGFERKKMNCFVESKQGITTEVCSCDTDKCNDGNSLKLAKMIVIFAALILIFK